MITYIYWSTIIIIAAAIFGFCGKKDKWKIGSTLGLLVLATGWCAYYFSLQQVFVKRYGGVMSIQVPEGSYHIGATWKDDNLWIENFNPKTNTCTFSEYSKGNMLQGKVTIKNCKPLPKILTQQ